jgi:hypothetical protein
MGGNALNFETRRASRNEYDVIRSYVLLALRTFFNDSSRRIEEIPAYRQKPDFGDLDVLLETRTGDLYHYKTIITELFNPKQVVQNGHIYSFDYDNFQVDLILTPTDIFQTSIDYFSNNDAGNLAGRLAKKLGFKYGHDGLTYMFRGEDQTHSVYDETIVSKDTAAIHKFLDLDHQRFIEGFDTLEEMFIWIASSKYFHSDIYLFHNRNYTSRIRDQKRKTYNQFLTWCAVTPVLNAYPWTQMREQDGYAGKPEFLKLALDTFPDFATRHAEIVKKHANHKIVTGKFNGNIVRELTGFEGRQLGEFMQHLLNNNGGKEHVYKSLLLATNFDVNSFIMLNVKTFNVQQ